MRRILLLVFLGLVQFVHGQFYPLQYSPLEYFPVPEEDMKELVDQFDQKALDLNITGKKERELATEFLDQLRNDLLGTNQSKHLSQDDSLTIYLQKIADRIAEANGLKKNYYRIFLRLSDVPNASNYGEGIILFNLGLLSHLPSESHVAFVIGHEMAHDLQRHVLTGIENKVHVLESDAYKERVKQIEDQEYNKRALIMALRNELLSEFNEHGRHNELEADSISLILMQKAGYWLPAASEAIQLLDTIDIISPLTIDYPRFYTFSTFPFNPKWLEKEVNPLLGGNLEYYRLPDSLKTHPSCAIRDSLIQLNYSSLGINPRQARTETGMHNRYGEMARFEHLEWLKNHGQYAELQYRAMAMLKEYPDNIYLKNTVGMAMYGLLSALYSRLYSQAWPMSRQTTPEDYAKFLDFLHNLKLSHLKNHFIGYAEERIPDNGIDDYSDMLHTLVNLILEEDQEEQQYLIQEYKNKYGENRHFEFLQKQFPEPIKSKRKRR